MPIKIKRILKITKHIIISVLVLPYIPLTISFFSETGKNVGIFIKNLYFFIAK